MTMENVKDKIRTLRTALGLTQEELARQIDVSLATVQRWETDKVVPSRLARKELVRLFKKAGIN
jgi:DNA-binding transcriptional regulator YiaG